MNGRRYNWANFLRILALGVWIVAFLWLLAGDAQLEHRFEHFIDAKFWPLPVGGLILAILFFFGAYTRFGQSTSHGIHLPERIAQSAILLLPLAYMVVGVSAGGLGADAFRTRSVGSQTPPGVSFRNGPEVEYKRDGSVNKITLLQLLNDLDQLDGLPVELVGRVYHEESLDDGSFIAYRFMIVCCAADALPVGTVVSWPEGHELQEDQWVRIVGRVEERQVGDQTTARINAIQVESIDPPRKPYLSPY